MPGSGLTYRRMMVLVRALPAESASARAFLGKAGQWTTDHELLAILADRVGVLAWMYAATHSKRGTAGKKPEPIPRPDAPGEPAARRAPRRRHMTPEEMRHFFGGAVRQTRARSGSSGNGGPHL